MQMLWSSLLTVKGCPVIPCNDQESLEGSCADIVKGSSSSLGRQALWHVGGRADQEEIACQYRNTAGDRRRMKVAFRYLQKSKSG